MSGQINQYPIEATVIDDDDYVDIDKYLGEVPIGVNPYESQKIKGINLNYNSGVKKIPWHNGVFGLANTGDLSYAPTIEIQNRIVKINGVLVLPLQKTPGVLDGSGSGYPDEPFQELFLSTLNGGWQVTSQAYTSTHDPILPTNLLPEVTVNLEFNPFITRQVKDDAGLRNRLTAYANSVNLLSDGRLNIQSIEATERDGSTNPNSKRKSHLMRKVTSKFERDDRVTLYDNYNNSFDNSGAIDKTINNTVSAGTYTFTHDASYGENYGGYIIAFNFTYNISSLISIAQIKSAFDAL